MRTDAVRPFVTIVLRKDEVVVSARERRDLVFQVRARRGTSVLSHPHVLVDMHGHHPVYVFKLPHGTARILTP